MEQAHCRSRLVVSRVMTLTLFLYQVIYDTLIEQSTPEEVEAVIGEGSSSVRSRELLLY